MNNVSLISDLDPEAKNLEGYLFPDTYEFSPETTAAEVDRDDGQAVSRRLETGLDRSRA